MRVSNVYIKLKDYTKADRFLTKAEQGATLNAVISPRNGKTLLTNLYDTHRNILMGAGKVNEALAFSLRYEK